MTVLAACTDGYVLAERLGLAALSHHSGDDGAAYFLEDGRVLKATRSEVEAAVALALLEVQNRAGGHPSVPRIHDLRWIAEDVDYSDLDPRFGVRTVTRYVIVRDDFADLDFDEGVSRLWKFALEHLSHGWRNKREEHLAEARRLWDWRGDEIRQALDGLRWLEASTGVRVFDIRPSNLGRGPSGAVGMRDLGRGVAPEPLLERVRTLAFDPVPEAPSPRP